MFVIQRPESRFPQPTYRRDNYPHLLEERYYRDLAEEHSRRADPVLRRAQQERQRAVREQELRPIRARQYQEQLARRSPWAPNLIILPTQHPHSTWCCRSQTNLCEVILPAQDANSNHRKRKAPPGDTLLPTRNPPSRTKARGEQLCKRNLLVGHLPQSVNPAPSFWDLFGGLQALEEEDAIVRQLNLFGERSKAWPDPLVRDIPGQPGLRKLQRPRRPPILRSPYPLTPPPLPRLRRPRPPTATSSGVPRLSYSSSYISVHDYENDLNKLLTKLDAVASGGAQSIRGARTALVVAVEKELDELDEEKTTAWRNSIVEADVPAALSGSNSVPETQSDSQGDALEVESP
ncbi:hypothetical protein FRC01_006853 [Tulasnella sp. 417]|nr:hypothetical protein FRC01_006853 [Tulasnella sp. 417]